MSGHYMSPDISDASIVRYCLRQMTNDDPFYIADISHSQKQYYKWIKYLPRVKPYYAVKSNTNHFIIKVLEKMGCGFDCASIDELDSVLSICPNIDCSKRIIYAHPCKQISHILYFKNHGVQLTVADNINELIKIQSYWSNAKILIRLKAEDSQSLIAFSSKFGVNEYVARQMFECAKTLNLNLVGCTFHVGTGCFNKYAFTNVLQFAKKIFDIANSSIYNFNFTILDIGGGFPGIDEDDKPTFLDMAEQINITLNQLFPDNQNIEIISEPGRYFSAGCMKLVTTITGCRLNNIDYSDNLSTDNQINNNVQIFYYVNDGIYGSLSNIIYEKATYRVSCLRQHYIRKNFQEKEYNSSVYGPTCDSTDCLAKSVYLPLLDIGDNLWFHNIGAYSNTTSTNFNGFKTTKYFYIWKD